MGGFRVFTRIWGILGVVLGPYTVVSASLVYFTEFGKIGEFVILVIFAKHGIRDVAILVMSRF